MKHILLLIVKFRTGRNWIQSPRLLQPLVLTRIRKETRHRRFDRRVWRKLLKMLVLELEAARKRAIYLSRDRGWVHTILLSQHQSVVVVMGIHIL